MRHTDDGNEMQSVRKHEALSTGLLVALGMTLGICLGQAGTARAILTHTHGHIRPIAARSSSHSAAEAEPDYSTYPGPTDRPERTATGGARQHHHTRQAPPSHAGKAPAKKKSSHKPKHGKKRSHPGTGHRTPPASKASGTSGTRDKQGHGHHGGRSRH